MLRGGGGIGRVKRDICMLTKDNLGVRFRNLPVLPFDLCSSEIDGSCCGLYREGFQGLGPLSWLVMGVFELEE